MKLTIVFLLLFSCGVLAVQITEIMYAPNSEWGGQYNEWVEICNPSEKEINLTGWKLNTTTGKQIEGIIKPYECIIVAKKPDIFSEYYDVNCAVVKGTFTLKNDGTTLTLYDSEENLVDSFTYVGELAFKNNKTLERSGKESAVDGGTPCVWEFKPKEADKKETEESSDNPLIIKKSVVHGIIDYEKELNKNTELVEMLRVKEEEAPEPASLTGRFTLKIEGIKDIDPIKIVKSILKYIWIRFSAWVDSLFEEPPENITSNLTE